jgi:hypothetical protein
MGDVRYKEMVERFRQWDAARHAPITDENMLGCIEELKALFLRRRIAADCTLVLPGLTVDFRLEGPATTEAATTPEKPPK